ncbi:MAG: tetratricopeptide repeat protein, partial [Planctomycetota bacterium]
FDPAVHVLRARIAFARGQLDAGRDACRRALEIAPDHIPALLAMAHYQHLAGDDEGALAAYRSVIEHFPEEASALEACGRFEITLGRKAEALEHVSRAVVVLEANGELPAPQLLLDGGNLALQVRGSEVAAVHLARRLHTFWPGWRRSANELLARFWAAADCGGLSRAHTLAANRIAGSAVYSSPYPPRPVTFDEVVATLKAGYTVDMLLAMLEETSLGFQLMSRETLDALVRAGLGSWQADVLATRYQLDQTNGSNALAGLLELKFTGSVHTDDPVGPWVDLTITNHGTIPLTGIQLRKTYYDADNHELWSSEGELQTASPLLKPGESRRVRFRLNRWTVLLPHQLTATTIHHFQVEATGACNATFVTSIGVSGAIQPAGYELRVANNTMFAVTHVQLRCEFLDQQGQPLRNAAGRAIVDWRTRSMQLAPGEQSAPIVVADWTNWDWLHGLGIPSSMRSVNMRVTVVDAVATRIR